MLKISVIVLLAIALVATNAVRKSSFDIKVEIGGGDEDNQVHQFSNFEEDYSIHNEDQIMAVDSNDIDGIDNVDSSFVRTYRFGNQKEGMF